MSERDPLGKAAHEAGSKLDAGKAPILRGVLQYFPRALLKVAALSDYGAHKYAWKGWASVPDGANRYGDALGRHLLKEETEGKWDKEIENDPNFPACVLHATQVAWNALARLELMLRGTTNFSIVKPRAPVREQMDPVETEKKV